MLDISTLSEPLLHSLTQAYKDGYSDGHGEGYQQGRRDGASVDSIATLAQRSSGGVPWDPMISFGADEGGIGPELLFQA
jgi:hypothetical protein